MVEPHVTCEVESINTYVQNSTYILLDNTTVSHAVICVTLSLYKTENPTVTNITISSQIVLKASRTDINIANDLK